MDETTSAPDPGTIYVVVGEAGEYSSHETWMVAWYRDKDRAEAHVAAANAEAARIYGPIAEWNKTRELREPVTYLTPYPDPLPPDVQFDPQMACFNEYSVASLVRGKWPFDLPPEGTVK